MKTDEQPSEDIRGKIIELLSTDTLLVSRDEIIEKLVTLLKEVDQSAREDELWGMDSFLDGLGVGGRGKYQDGFRDAVEQIQNALQISIDLLQSPNKESQP